jgi:hypothetical protein
MFLHLDETQNTRLARVMGQVSLSETDVAERFGADFDYGIAMARLISERDRAALAARSGDAPTEAQLRLLNAFGLYAARNGNTVLSAKIFDLIEDFDADFGRVSHAINVCQTRLGKLPEDLVPRYENNGQSVGRSTSTDISGILPDLPADEAV